MATGQGMVNRGPAARFWCERRARVRLNGQTRDFDTFKTAVACGAIYLPSGIRPFPTNLPPALGRFVYLVNGMARTELARHALGVLRGTVRSARHFTGFAGQLSVQTAGRFVLDGERHACDPSEWVTLSAGEPVRVVSVRRGAVNQRH